MEEPEKQEKKVTELKTYQVPFSFTENKENITINTHKASSASKEQIVSQAFKFHAEGKILEAAKLSIFHRSRIPRS
tara:strand:- start:166 stop:393 length:228 start_codon:yes stop_codon:yes gene_type:complete